METGGWQSGGTNSGMPSMEPQPFGHGNLSPLVKKDQGQVPSMEPQPFGHGNVPKGHVGCVLFQNLQWSHSLSAMETREDDNGYY